MSTDEDDAGHPQRAPRDLTRIEERDHQHGPHVVDDGQRREEDLESAWRAWRDERQRAEREGDVGGHRNRPPSRRHSSAVGQGIDRGGDDHAADGRRDRQRRLARRRQFAGQRLTLDLQADQEKEDGHQAVVDPLMKGERQRMPAAGDGDRRRPQAVVGVGPCENWPRRARRTHRRRATPRWPLPFGRIPGTDSMREES